MEAHHRFTRAVLGAVWSVAGIALAVWALLAWGGHALLSDSGSWLHSLVDPWIASAAWDQRLATLLAWGESAGTVVLWLVWALGSLGLVLTAGFATLLYRRAERALASTR